MSSEIYADALAPFRAEVDVLRPAGAEVIDAHTHLGLDEDGRSLTLDQLLTQLDDAGAQRACVFPLHDPERQPAYRVPNDRVLAWAGESERRLVPFSRLGPFSTAALQRSVYAERRGFEYWGHMASWLPMADYRYFLPRMEAIRQWDRASGKELHRRPRDPHDHRSGRH